MFKCVGHVSVKPYAYWRHIVTLFMRQCNWLLAGKDIAELIDKIVSVEFYGRGFVGDKNRVLGRAR